MLVIASLLIAVEAVFEDDHPILKEHESLFHIVTSYFARSYTNLEILSAISLGHGVSISLSTLKIILKKLKLYRRREDDSVETIVQAILEDREVHGFIGGYRTTWKRLKTLYKIHVKRDTVMRALRVIEPESVQRRQKHRLQRRQYINLGPNFLWHIDGYDKLKPYGFAIHGCIDGYSRRILWLEVGPSNNNPNVIVSYYLQCLKRLNVTARLNRADRGTENSLVEVLQTYFRFNDDDTALGFKSFIYGKSSSNQRIEAWWSILRKQFSDWWICFFKDIRDRGIYDENDNLHMECLRFCFTKVIRKGLNNIASQWNQHRLQVKKNAEGPPGIPDILYFFPETRHTENFGNRISSQDIDACTGIFVSNIPNEFGCSENLLQIVQLVKPNYTEPRTPS